MLCTLFSTPTKWTSRVLLPALVLLGGNLTAADPPPANEKKDAKKTPDSCRAYLPTIRLKALRDTERQSVTDLENWLGWYNVWLNGGLVNLVQRGQLEEEYHRSQLRALRLDADYRDSLDQFTSQFRESEERRRQMEDAAISSIVKVFQRFQDLFHDNEAALGKLDEIEGAEDAAKLRQGVIKLLTESALVKNTTLPKRFLKNWEKWKIIDDQNKLMKRIAENREELAQIRKRQYELEEKQRELPNADRLRKEALRFDTDLLEFQYALLSCEKQPWKNEEDDAIRLMRRRETIYALSRVVKTILDYSYVERLARPAQSWPRLAPVKVKDVDLLAVDSAMAEETVASLLKTPDSQLAGKKKVRHIRTLAESYPIQQRLCYLAFVLRDNLKNAQKNANTRLPSGDIIPPGLVGPLGSRSSIDVRPFEPGGILRREAALKQAKRQILQTWIDYQMLRLDLYGALGVAPPKR